MIDSGEHPGWCSRAVCTAFIDSMEPLHRSEPIVIESGEPGTALYVYRTADPDGSGEYVTIAKLDHPAPGAWFLVEPIGGHEILLPKASADAAQHALAEMT